MATSVFQITGASTATLQTYASTIEVYATQAQTSATNAAASATSAANSAASTGTNATTAATKATEAATSASNALASENASNTSAVNAAASATTASGHASTASTQASNASSSATTASSQATAAAASATTASSEASAAATSETNAATSATNAATSETNAATSETNAATSATNASTSASNASTSATNAASSASAASTSETNAATSESNASTSATNSATSASTASTQATNAANSATAAATSATNAATSATSAASSASTAQSLSDSFNNIYLGALSSAPSQDPDGSALDLGDLYYDTTQGELKVYKSSGWAAAGSTVNGTSARFHYDITTTTGTVSGSDANGNTLAYDAGYVDVYVNGVRMSDADVTTTSGNSIVFTEDLVNGDDVDIVAYGTFVITQLNADNLDSGTVPSARVSGAYTGITSVGTLTSFASTGIDDNASSTAMTLDSSGNVGIGGAIDNHGGYARVLQITGAGESAIELENSTGYSYIAQNGANIQIRNNATGGGQIFYTSSTEAMRIDSSGNLLVGKTSTGLGTAGVELSQNGVAGKVFMTRSGGESLSLNRLSSDGEIVGFYKDSTLVGSIGTQGGTLEVGSGDVYLQFNGTNDWIKPVDGSGSNKANVDLGTSGAKFKDLYLSNSVRLKGATRDISIQQDNYGLRVYDNDASSERFRIDASGNLLVGKSNTTANVAGTEIEASGTIVSTRNNNTNIFLNRMTSDGNLIEFRKDNTTVGSIGTDDGDLYIGTGVTGLQFFNAGNRVIPFNTNTGSLSNNTTDLGDPNFRFKNLYLSEHVNLSNGTTNAFLQSGGDLFQFGTSNSKSVVFYSNNTERMRIDSSGIVNINCTTQQIVTNERLRLVGKAAFTTSGDAALNLNRDSDNGGTLRFHRGTTQVGEISVTASSTNYGTSSDHRLKENVTADWDATTRLKQLNPVRFNFIADADTTVDGFLAHEVQSVVPEAISGTHNEVDAEGNPVYQGIDQSKLVPLLVKTIQELEARITALENA